MRKVPRRFEKDDCGPSLSETVEDHYRLQYLEVIELAVSSIKERFDQPGFVVYSKLEKLLLEEIAGNDNLNELLSEVSEVYHELDNSQLKLQLSYLATYFQENGTVVSLKECLKYLRGISPMAKTFYSEVCTVVRLILVMPQATLLVNGPFQLCGGSRVI